MRGAGWHAPRGGAGGGDAGKIPRAPNHRPTPRPATARGPGPAPTSPPSPSSASATSARLVDGSHDAQRLDGLRHIVHANDVRAGLHRHEVSRNRAAEPLLRLGWRNEIDEPLARKADEDWQTKTFQFRQPGDDLDALLRRLAKADAGIEHEAVAGDAGF